MSAIKEVGRSMGSHQSARMISESWITPKYILDSLGVFDLDPCCADSMPWQTAIRSYVKSDGGLTRSWEGRVWLNPPYGNKTIHWLRKLADHGNGIALIFARTETKMFFETVWNKASAVLFIEGRLFFHYPDGIKAKANAGAPSVLIAYGNKNVESLKFSGIKGKFIQL